MKVYKLALAILVFGCCSEVNAQVKPVSMQQFYQQELHRLAKKVYLMGLKGEVAGYTNDSLVTQYSAESMKMRGADLVKTFAVHWYNECQDIDTSFCIMFNPESLCSDLGVSFQIQPDWNGNVLYNLLGIAPMFIASFAGMELPYPLFYAKWNEIKDKLLPDESELLIHYFFWKVQRHTRTGTSFA